MCMNWLWILLVIGVSGRVNGYLPATQTLKKMPNLNLYHVHRRYLLEAGGVSEVIRDNEIEQLFPRPESDVIDIVLSPMLTAYEPETLYSVDLRTRKDGFVSYLLVFGNATTVLMLGNQQISPGAQIHYLDIQLYDGLSRYQLRKVLSNYVSVT